MPLPDEAAIAAQLDDIARKYWALWILALVLYLAHWWAGWFVFALMFTFLLSLLIWEMIIPYIGLTWALGTGIDGFNRAVRNNLILALLNLLAAIYSLAGIWKAWPYVWTAIVFSMFVSALNGQAAGPSKK